MVEEALFEKKDVDFNYVDPIAGMQLKEQKGNVFFQKLSNWIFILLIPLFGPIGAVITYSGIGGILSLSAMKLPIVVKILLSIVIAIYTIVFVFLFILFAGCVVLEV